MSEMINNKDDKKIAKAAPLRRRNSDFNWKCLIILSFFILSAISIFSFSHYNNKFLVDFKNYFGKKDQKKKEPVKRTYSFYVTKITKIIVLIATILSICAAAIKFYKDFFLKKKHEIVDKEDNHSCFIAMLLAICLDEKDESNLHYWKSRNTSNYVNVKHNRQIFFFTLLKKKAREFAKFFLYNQRHFLDVSGTVDKKIDEKIIEILTKKKLASLFRALIEIQNADINYFYLRNAYSFKELSDNKTYKQYRNRCLFRTLLQFFEIIAYYVFNDPVVSYNKGFDISFKDLDDVEKNIKKRADEDNFVLVDSKKYVFSGASLEEDLKDLYNNDDTDDDIDI